MPSPGRAEFAAQQRSTGMSDRTSMPLGPGATSSKKGVSIRRSGVWVIPAPQFRR